MGLMVICCFIATKLTNCLLKNDYHLAINENYSHLAQTAVHLYTKTSGAVFTL